MMMFETKNPPQAKSDFRVSPRGMVRLVPFDTYAESIILVFKCNDSYTFTITGDASRTYINLNHGWRKMPGNAGLKEPKYVILDYIHKFLPKAKLIMVVRDPVDR